MKRCASFAAFAVVLLCALFVLRTRAVGLPPNCPVSLTNPDGQALTLEKYDLRVAVHGPLALIEMEMVFRNPEARQMEGRFQYLLPPGATISRFAKEVNGKLMEGEVVERLRAQAVYTEILHTMRDPALLEMDQGNRFSARVFPIPPNGTVRLLLGYSQVLAAKNGERKLTVPLAGMPAIGSFSFTPVIAAEAGVELRGLPEGAHDKLANFTPERDLELSFKADKKGNVEALKAGNFQLLCFWPINSQDTLEPERDWTFYFDTSASNADTEKARLHVIELLVERVKPGPRPSVPPGTEGPRHGHEWRPMSFTSYAFDVDVSKLETIDSTDPKTVHMLRARHAVGATNLEAAMKHIGEQARAAQKPTCFVLVSDGIATLGARESRDVVAALGEWPAQHVMHALVIGNKQDEKMLAAIVAKTNGRVVVFPFNEKPEEEAARVLGELRAPLGASFEFYDEGTAWIYPKTFRDVQPGSELVVFSELKDGAPSKPGVVQRGGDGKIAKDTVLTVAPGENPAFAPLLQREAYHAFLDHIEKVEQAEKNEAMRAELHKQRIEVSVKNRVLCPLTSLLVLETENDYRRFGIERTALADILVVGANGIELKKRGPDEVPPPGADLSARTKMVRKAALPLGVGEAIDGHVARPRAPAPRAQRPGEAAGDDDADDAKGGAPHPFAENINALDEKLLDALGGAIDHNANPDAAPAPAGVGRAPIRPITVTATTDSKPFEARPAESPATQPAQAGEVSALEGENRREARGEAAPRQGGAAPPRANAIPVAPNATPGKPVLPAWVQQYGVPVKDEQLSELRAKVQAQPRDRMLRNAYADLLKKAGQWDSLQGEAFAWLPFDPENPQVYEFLGNSATGLNDPELALRAFTSIAEIAPNRAALLARAGWLLLTAAGSAGVPPASSNVGIPAASGTPALPAAGPLAHARGSDLFHMSQEMFREALKNRQDDCNIYRGLAFSLWLDGKYNEAAKVLEEALGKSFNQRYGDVKRVMREELGYILRAWQKKEPAQNDAINQRANNAGVRLDQYDALRVTMCWETDANDVDLHVVDPNGEECFYSHKQNQSGLELYSDQTQGLGPEVIRTVKALPGTYHVAVNYFNAGPMGASRGMIVVLQPKDGVTEEPLLVPFCLVPGGPDMRHLAVAKF